MAAAITSAAFIQESQQHAFLDFAKSFDWDAVKRSIECNPALVTVQPGMRWSALHQAAYCGDADVVSFLLIHNADTAALSEDGKTPWEVAQSGKDGDEVRSILSHFSSGGARRVPTPVRASSKPAVSKAMKALKAMKVKNVMKSKIAKGRRSKALVYKGKFEKTVGGLKKEHLTRNKTGKIVSKKLQAQGKKSYANIERWVQAFQKARAQLGLTGFVAINKTSPLYAKTVELYQPSAAKQLNFSH